MIRAVLFDALGTLFDLGSLEKSPELARTLHHAASLTLVGEFVPLERVAHAVDAKLPDALGAVGAYDDAAPALELLAAAEKRAYVLTNGSVTSTRKLIANSKLDGLVKDVFSVDDVKRYKPHAAPYKAAAERIGLPVAEIALVAAHEWDILGARHAGLGTVYVDREDEGWRLPVDPPDLIAYDLVEAARLAVEPAA